MSKETSMARAMTRRDPFSRLIELRTHFDRVFDDLESEREGTWAPAIDVVRDGDALIVRAELPGIKPEELTIEVEGDVLTVSGQHEESQEEKSSRGSYLRRERRLGAFARSIALPPGVDVTQIKAETHDGVVELTVPLPKGSRPARVQITPSAG
jgi:HSP20 family protein